MLTDIRCRAAKPREKAFKMYDASGLYLLVNPNGSRWWRFDYHHAGKRKTISLGVYPTTSLKGARGRRDAARGQLAAGIDPSLARKASRGRVAGESFEAIAREWHARQSPTWVAAHIATVLRQLERDVFPWVGARPVGELKAPELLTVLRRIEARGSVDLAHRVLQNCGRVFRYAVATGRAERDPAADLRGALQPSNKQRHHASITDAKEIGALLRAIDGYRGSFAVRCALQLAPLTFVRPGELRAAEWSEFDLETAEWRIPAERMKIRGTHIVPLSVQAVEVLRDLRPLTGSGRFVFPGLRSGERPMSQNAITAALRRMGFAKHEMTGHGFRSMASTLLNEQAWNRDAIERQLAHSERNAVRAAYNYAEHLPERRRMMQAWADYLDGLRGALQPSNCSAAASPIYSPAGA